MTAYENGREDAAMANGYNNTWISAEDQEAYRKGFMDETNEWREYLKASRRAELAA